MRLTVAIDRAVSQSRKVTATEPQSTSSYSNAVRCHGVYDLLHGLVNEYILCLESGKNYNGIQKLFGEVEMAVPCVK